jgi:hypothetical protein
MQVRSGIDRLRVEAASRVLSILSEYTVFSNILNYFIWEYSWISVLAMVTAFRLVPIDFYNQLMGCNRRDKMMIPLTLLDIRCIQYSLMNLHRVYLGYNKHYHPSFYIPPLTRTPKGMVLISQDSGLLLLEAGTSSSSLWVSPERQIYNLHDGYAINRDDLNDKLPFPRFEPEMVYWYGSRERHYHEWQGYHMLQYQGSKQREHKGDAMHSVYFKYLIKYSIGFSIQYVAMCLKDLSSRKKRFRVKV